MRTETGKVDRYTQSQFFSSPTTETMREATERLRKRKTIGGKMYHFLFENHDDDDTTHISEN